MHLRLFRTRCRNQNVPFCGTVGVVDVDLNQKPVKLGFGQRIGAFLFNRVLRGQHMERAAQRTVLAGDGDLAFLHRLQQRRLGARAGAVDLIRHQQLAEDRAFDEAEIAAAVSGCVQHLGPQDIGRHQVRRELNAVALQPHDGRQRVHKARLSQARQTDQQGMPAAEHGRQNQIHHLFLTDEAAVDAHLRLRQPLAQSLDFGDQVLRLGHDNLPCKVICLSDQTIPPRTNGKRTKRTNDCETFR